MKRSSLLLLFFSLFILFGCSDFSPSGGSDLGNTNAAGPGGGGGATPGGSQDFDYIRYWINNGYVPQAENFLVEGIYSEYDLPIEGEASTNILSVRAAAAYAGASHLPGSGLYVQLGLSSSINVENFQRKPLNLCVVVDKSGSMLGGKIALVRTALTSLIDQLDESDILSIVLFNHEASILLEPTAVTAKNRLKGIVSEIKAEGSTDIDSGLRLGYHLVRQNIVEDERSDRVILFTDALPNTGNTAPGNFKELVGDAAAAGIGLTAFGAGMDFNQSLMDFFATQTNCNYLFLRSEDDIAQVFDEYFDFLVSPIVNDLSVTIECGDRFNCDAAYGFPGEQDSDPSIDVKTVFLSRNRGALMLAFKPRQRANPLIPAGSLIAKINLSYREVGGVTRVDQLRVNYSGDDIVDTNNSYYEQDGVRLCVALTREVLGMQPACELYHNQDVANAVELLDSLTELLRGENRVLGEDVLLGEIGLVQQLRLNMQRE